MTWSLTRTIFIDLPIAGKGVGANWLHREEIDGISIQGVMDERLTPYLVTRDRKNDVITCPNLLATSCDDNKQ